jgi:hypothetical protein
MGDEKDKQKPKRYIIRLVIVLIVAIVTVLLAKGPLSSDCLIFGKEPRIFCP